MKGNNMTRRRLVIHGDATYKTETITSLLFQDDVVIELPDNCELRNTDEIGKYKIVITKESDWYVYQNCKIIIKNRKMVLE